MMSGCGLYIPARYICKVAAESNNVLVAAIVGGSEKEQAMMDHWLKWEAATLRVRVRERERERE